MNSSPVTVRIAPSPSGYLHVGTARTALFNFLFARHTGGKFLIRIEDTDAARSDASLIEPILSALENLGLKWDDEIVYQSKRIEIYKPFAQKILDGGHGYRCFCTKEELAAERDKARAEKRNSTYPRTCLNLTPEQIDKNIADGKPFAIRLKVPEGEHHFNDMVSGDISRKSDDIEDFIIARSDGTATYNLAVVIDDHDMKISHVIRGNDHITNTFKQVMIYHALGFEVPRFGHVPLILRPDKKKVSKRLGDKDVGEYLTEGILPEAMVNYLSLLGWSPKTDNEIYTMDELIDIFRPENFNSSNSIFDNDKLLAFNRAHITRLSDHDLAEMVAPLLVEAGLTSKYWLETRWEFLRQVIGMLKPRVNRVVDFVELSGYFFSSDFGYDEQADKKQFTPEAAELLTKLADRFEGLGTFDHDSTEKALGDLAEELDLKRAKLIHPTRLAVSGLPGGPGLFDILVTLGQPMVVERMRKAVDYIGKKEFNS